MDYEKLYKEALERAKAKLEEAKVFDYDDEQTAHVIRQTVYDIFTELAESEDEKIRKDIIEYIRHSAHNIPAEKFNSWIAWLEKQGEQKHVEMKTAEESLGVSSKEYNKIVDECVYGEQKPVEYHCTGISSKDAEGILGEIIDNKQEPVDADYNPFDDFRKSDGEVNPSEFEARLNQLLKEFESLPKEELSSSLSFYLNVVQNDGTFKEQKPVEWSEEDEEHKEFILKCLSVLKEEHWHHIGSSKIDGGMSWLKSLKDRCLPQPKQEWSKEDEEMLKECDIAITMSEGHTIEEKENLSNWLKSLRLQKQCGYKPYKEVIESIAEMCEKYAAWDSNLQDFYDNVKVKCKDAKEYDAMFPHKQWKPSEEQMNALKEAFNTGSITFHDMEVLAGLWETLKAL